MKDWSKNFELLSFIVFVEGFVLVLQCACGDHSRPCRSYQLITVPSSVTETGQRFAQVVRGLRTACAMPTCSEGLERETTTVTTQAGPQLLVQAAVSR